MATREEEIQGMIDRGEGGVFVDLTNNDGSSAGRLTWEQAKKLGFTTQAISQNGQAYYLDDNGKITAKEPQKVKLDLDKKTGKLTITAPTQVANNETFKARVKTLSEYSQAYALDPNYSVPALNDTGTATTNETVSVTEVFDRIANKKDSSGKTALDYWAEEANGIENARAELQRFARRATKNPDLTLDLTDNDVMRAYQIALDNKTTGEKANDKSLQLLSNLEEADFMRKASGYNEDTGLVDLGSLMKEGWNRDRVSDDKIKQLQGALERYFAKGDFSNADDFARNYATYVFINGQDPGVNFFRGTAENIGSFVLGLLKKGADTAVTAMKIGGKMTGADFIADNFAPVKDFKERVFDGKNFADWAADEMDKWFTDWSKDRALVNDGNVTMLGLGDALGKILEIIAIGNAGEKVVKGIVANGATKMAGISKAIVNGTELTSKNIGLAAKTLINFLGAQRTAQVMNAVAGFLNSEKVVGMVGVIGETLGESIVGDQAMFRAVLSSGDLDEEARAYLMENWVWNSVGLGIALKAADIAEAIKQTPWGAAFNHNWSRSVKAFTSALGDIADSVRMKIRGYDNINDLIKTFKNPKKQDAWRMARAVRNMDRALAQTPKVISKGKTLAEVQEQIATARKAADALMEMDNAITNLARGGRSIVNYWTNSSAYPDLKASTKALQETTDAIVKAEKGLDGFKSAAKTPSGKLFSELTSNYIGSVQRLDYITNFKRIKGKAIDPSDLDGIEKETVWLKENIAKFTNRATPELKALADKFIGQNRTWWGHFTDTLVNEHVLSRSQIEKLRELGYWGDDGVMYARTQRRVAMSEWTRARRDGRVDTETWSSLQHTSFGSTDDFADPILVQQSELYRRANQKARQDVARAHLNSGVANSTIKVGGDQTQAVRELEKSKPVLQKATTQYAQGIGDNLRQNGVVNAMASQKAATAKVSAATKKELMAKTRSSVIAETTDANIKKVFSKASGFDNVDDYMNAELVLGDASTIEPGVQDVFDTYAKRYDGALPLSKAKGKVDVSYENYRLIANADDTFNTAIMRGYDSTNPKALKDKTIDNLVRDRFKNVLADYIAKSTDFGNAALDITQEIQDQVAIYVKNVTQSDTRSSEVIRNLAKAHGGAGDEIVEQYLALRSLESNLEVFDGKFRQDLIDDFKKIYGDQPISSNLPEKEADKLIEQIKAAVTDQADTARLALANTFPDLVDADDIYKKVNDIAEDITKAKRDATVIALPNAEGEVEFIQIDPLIADLVKTQAPVKELSKLGHVNYLLMKLFRLGTTGINIRSLVNQQFRDYLNAFVSGGAYRSVQECADELEDVFGRQVVEELANFEPDELKAIRELAQREGISEGAAFAKRELERGRAVSPAATETDARRITREANELRYSNVEYKAGVLRKTEERLDKTAETLGKLSEFRETTVRNRSYANAFTDAIKNGASLRQARNRAVYVMNHASTNFSQLMTHLTALQDTVPYLGAAISGAKSFWKLWSLDPVGVTGRLFGGLILPAIYFTGYSLSTEENRELWRQIPEYQKDDSICFIVEGQVMSIPIPQEMAALVAPFRQFVEYLHGANNKAFWQLMANDILNLSPVDINGFLNIDGAQLLSDNNVLNNLGTGLVQLIAENSPVYVKTAIMAATGIDPYTMRPIDKSHKYIDPDTGKVEIMDSTQGAFANLVSKIANKFHWSLSPSAADALLGSIMGNANVDVLDSILSWGQAIVPGGEEGSLIAPFENIINEAVKPLTVEVYSKSESDWNQAVGALQAERDAILQSEDWDLYIEARRKATSEADWKRVAAMRANLIDPYYEKVKGVVDRLVSVYGQDFTPRKFATVLALMNTNEGGIDAGAYGDSLNQDTYQAGKRAAIATMADMGFQSASNRNIFGEYVLSEKGEPYMRYYQPLQVLNAQNMKWYGDETHMVNMEKLLKEAGLTKSERYQQYNKLTTKSEKKKFRQNWNARVVNALYPYVRQYGANAIMTSDVVDMLDNYIYVDNPYQAKDYLIEIFGGK